MTIEWVDAPAAVVADAVEQVAVGDAGGGEEAVLAGDEVVEMQDPVEVVAGCASPARLSLVARPEAPDDRAAEALDRGGREHALRGAADAPQEVDAGAVARGEQRAGDVAVGDEADAGAGPADLLDHLRVSRAVEQHDHQVADEHAALVRDRRRTSSIGSSSERRSAMSGAAGHLLHVDARARVEHRALLGDRDDRERVRHAAGDERRPLERIDGHVDARARAVADVLAVVEHGRLVLLALADHDDAVHRDGVEHVAHRVDGRLIRGDLVAGAHEAGGGERGGLGDAYELEGEVAIGHRCVHGARAYTAGATMAAHDACDFPLRRDVRPAPASLRSPRARTAARRLPRRAGRLAGAARGARRDARPTCERDNANLGGAFRASRASDDVIEAGRAAIADFVGGASGRDRVRREHDDAQLPARARGRAHARAGRRDRDDLARPRRERLAVAARRAGSRDSWCASSTSSSPTSTSISTRSRAWSTSARGSSRSRSRRTRSARSRMRAAHRRDRPSRRRARVGRRRPLRPTSPDRRRRTRRRRAAVLAVQVLRTAPRLRLGPTELLESWPADRVRPAEEHPAGPSLRDGDAEPRGDRRCDRCRRLPRLARRGCRPPCAARRRLRADPSLRGGAVGPRADAVSPRSPGYGSMASRTRRGRAIARRRSASRSRGTRRVRSPRRSVPSRSRAGTATTTRSRSCSGSGSRSTAAGSASGSCTTRPGKRSIDALDIVERLRRPADRYDPRPPRGCGGIGRRARFRSVWAKARGGSSPLIRTRWLNQAVGGRLVTRELVTDGRSPRKSWECNHENCVRHWRITCHRHDRYGDRERLEPWQMWRLRWIECLQKPAHAGAAGAGWVLGVRRCGRVRRGAHQRLRWCTRVGQHSERATLAGDDYPLPRFGAVARKHRRNASLMITVSEDVEVVHVLPVLASVFDCDVPLYPTSRSPVTGCGRSRSCSGGRAPVRGREPRRGRACAAYGRAADRRRHRRSPVR